MWWAVCTRTSICFKILVSQIKKYFKLRKNSLKRRKRSFNFLINFLKFIIYTAIKIILLEKNLDPHQEGRPHLLWKNQQGEGKRDDEQDDELLCMPLSRVNNRCRTQNQCVKCRGDKLQGLHHSQSLCQQLFATSEKPQELPRGYQKCLLR